MSEKPEDVKMMLSLLDKCRDIRYTNDKHFQKRLLLNLVEFVLKGYIDEEDEDYEDTS